MTLKSSALAVTLIALCGCSATAIGPKRDRPSLHARMAASSRAEADERKELEKIREEALRLETQASEVGESNPRAGCKLRAEARNKTCRDRAELFAKSHSSLYHTLSHPEDCKATFEVDVRTCSLLPEAR